MPENPFGELIDMMRSEGGGSGIRLCEGKITDLSPLTIDVGGIKVTGQMLKRSEGLAFRDPGETALLLSADDQLFYCICKVVST